MASSLFPTQGPDLGNDEELGLKQGSAARAPTATATAVSPHSSQAAMGPTEKDHVHAAQETDRCFIIVTGRHVNSTGEG